MTKFSLLLLLLAITSTLSVGSTAARAQSHHGRRHCKQQAIAQEEMAYMQPGGETNMERRAKHPCAKIEGDQMAYMQPRGGEIDMRRDKPPRAKIEDIEMAYMQPGGEIDMERRVKHPRARIEDIEMAYMQPGGAIDMRRVKRPRAKIEDIEMAYMQPGGETNMERRKKHPRRVNKQDDQMAYMQPGGEIDYISIQGEDRKGGKRTANIMQQGGETNYAARLMETLLARSMQRLGNEIDFAKLLQLARGLAYSNTMRKKPCNDDEVNCASKAEMYTDYDRMHKFIDPRK